MLCVHVTAKLEVGQAAAGALQSGFWRKKSGGEKTAKQEGGGADTEGKGGGWRREEGESKLLLRTTERSWA